MEAARARALRARASDAPPRRTGKALDAALDELGWHDALGAGPVHRRLGPVREPGRGEHRRRPPSTTSWPTRSAPGGDGSRRRRAAPARPRGRARPVVGDRLVGAGPRHRGARATTDAPSWWPRRSGRTRSSPSSPTNALTPARRARPRPRRSGLVEVTGRQPTRRDGPADWVDWHGAAAVAQLALAHELVGAARAMLELARQHALERIQFGRPIASFQAVRHRLAECLVARRGAAHACSTAAWEDPTPSRAALAKALAGPVRPHRGPPLPAGAGRHRLHRRAPVAPPLPPGRRARPAPRGRQRADPVARRRPARRPAAGPALPL